VAVFGTAAFGTAADVDDMSVVYEETVAELVGCLDKPLVEGWEPVRTSSMQCWPLIRL